MKILKLNSADEFLKYNEEFLIKKESFYNLILGLAYSIKDKKLEPDNPLFYSIIDNENNIIGAALRTNQNKTINISEMSFKCVDLLINELKKENITLFGVMGEENCTTYFKNKWCEINNLSFRINMNLGVYENNNIIKPEYFYGTMIVATEKDKETVYKYLKAYISDCFVKNPYTDEEIEKMTIRIITNKILHLLISENNQIISMAGINRETLNGGTVAFVYTPLELRGKGYASSIVYLLTQKILSYKKFANLFTDLLNPTSNSIYQKLGYVKIGQNIDFEFIKK